MSVAAGLARACHPLPSLAVTAFAALLAAAAGATPGRTALVAATVATGQLSIGWLNDAVDADVDTAAGRRDKPVVAGLVRARTLLVAAVVAAAVCVPLSLALGALPGMLHLLLVASGWAYDLWLKGTVASPLPYLVAFGVLPVVAATAAGAAVPWLLAVAAGVLAVAAHFANTIPDVDADARTGVRGLPQRLGVRVSGWVAGAGVGAGCVVVLAGAWSELPVPAVVLLVGAAAVGAVSVVFAGAASFRLVLGAAALAVLGVAVAAPVLLRG